MAKMGKGIMSGEQPSNGTILAAGTGVVITTAETAVPTVVAAPAFGAPIMREGFMTETGLLPSSPARTSTVIVSIGATVRP